VKERRENKNKREGGGREKKITEQLVQLAKIAKQG
jgi:hypothetical protein